MLSNSEANTHDPVSLAFGVKDTRAGFVNRLAEDLVQDLGIVHTSISCNDLRRFAFRIESHTNLLVLHVVLVLSGQSVLMM